MFGSRGGLIGQTARLNLPLLAIIIDLYERAFRNGPILIPLRTVLSRARSNALQTPWLFEVPNALRKADNAWREPALVINRVNADSTLRR